MANLERIQAVNLRLQECIDKANSLPDAEGGSTEDLSTILAEQAELIDELKTLLASKATAEPNLQEKTATENGEVLPDEGYDGLSKVIVNVASSGGENKLAKVMGNKSVEILAEDLEGVTSLRNYAFYGNTNLGNVTIPATVKTIGSGAFYNCRNMMYLRFPNHTSVPTLSNSNALSGTNADLQILVPANLLDEWKATTNWSSHASKIVSE